MSKQEKIVVGILVLLVVLLGAFREWVFVNVNFQLQYMYYDMPYYRVHSLFHFLNDYDYLTIYYSKWVLTPVFSILFMVLTLIIIRRIFNSRKLVIIALWAHGVLFATAAFAYLFGKLLDDPSGGYKIARVFMGILQSPVVLMILVPAFIFYRKKYA